MKTLNVTIELDPVNDGAVFVENRFKKKEEGALIIGTNGEKRIAGASEAQRILDILAELTKVLKTDPNYLIMGEKASESDNRFVNEAVELFSKITDPKMQEMLLKQIRALV